MTATLQTVCLVVLAVAIEISSAKWVVASTTGGTRKVRRKVLNEQTAAQRYAALLKEIANARRSLGLCAEDRLVVAYEAGQEGFWLERALRSNGLEAYVIDPSSLQVDRRARRAKTDRLDAQALALALWRYAGGEVQALRMVRVPTRVTEDSREWQRELDRLKSLRRGTQDRIVKKLRTHGIWGAQLDATTRRQLQAGQLKDFSGQELGPQLTTALGLELKRLEHIEQLIKELETKAPMLDEQSQTVIEKLMRLRSIGAVGARCLALLLFWRKFENRREVGACVGLVGTPYDSGTMRQDQGISKAGDPRLRALLIELSWMWLRHQPQSALSRWFAQRTQGTGARLKRVMIVALARKLAIALWRYVRDAVIPEGAVLKAA